MASASNRRLGRALPGSCAPASAECLSIARHESVVLIEPADGFQVSIPEKAGCQFTNFLSNPYL